MRKTPAPSLATNVAIALNAVIAVVDGDRPKVLCVRAPTDGPGQGHGRDLALPYGPFDPERHRTFEIGVREWVERQTHVSLGYVEQLYTFGDKGREAPAAALAGGAGERVVSVGYLALAPAPADLHAEDALWADWYSFFPWEDWRGGEPAILRELIMPGLEAWAGRATGKEQKKTRQARVNIAFGLDGFGWEEERTLDRYELMYEAELVIEALRDRGDEKTGSPETGLAMISDHRRILATAIGRLRGKLKYRPVIFEMVAPTFTLLQLQRTVETIVGFKFHKQNFRRSVEKSGFVEATGKMTGETGGRPAALFRVDREGLKDRAAAGLAIPRLRRPSE
ncbi:NUDIX hydrolase [Hyphococcus luteus]|uniref:NAD regulator n=1 Tax=Hyphococcus luteus TaxID=2058213 RepID=A0A2S7K9G4_9PROT|nr:NAD regulator [Marinicaulis flavus]PQA89132.1 NAD regulator [Marinicaulis flavus]